MLEPPGLVDHNPPLGCVPRGVFAFWEGVIFPGFPVKDPIADSRSVKSIGRDAPKADFPLAA